VISAQVGLPATPPDAPGLFRCAAPDAIGRVFRDTGMHDVAETDVHGFSEPVPLEYSVGGLTWGFQLRP
jgi:hypothetical protein